jgi:hypothetical protein
VTVPTVEEPLFTVAGEKLNDARYGSGGTRVRVRLYETPLELAVTVTLFTELTADVVTGKVVDDAPAATFAVGGTCTRLLSETSETFTPPEGAMSLSHTVPVTDPPPVTSTGSRLKPIRLRGTTVNEPWAKPPLYVAVTVTLVCELTAKVVPATETLVAPVGTGTDPNTCRTEGLELVNETDVPAGAGPFR